jgi:hypothetical protein
MRLLGAEAQDAVDALGRRILERLRDQAEGRCLGEPLELRVGLEPDLRAHLVERLGDRAGELLHMDRLRDRDADRGQARRLGREAGREVGVVVEHHVGPQPLDRSHHVREGGTGVDADEEVADHDSVRLVGIERAGAGEDRVACLLRRIGDRVVVEAGGGDHRRRRGGGGHDDVVVVAEQGVGKGNQGAEVAGSLSGADQDAHERGRRVLAAPYSLVRAFRRV